jgi:hypothetical protein
MNNIMMFDSVQEEIATVVVSESKLELLYSSYFTLFYTIYYILFLLLCLVVFRPNVFSLEALATLFYFSIFIGFLTLSCGVTL